MGGPNEDVVRDRCFILKDNLLGKNLLHGLAEVGLDVSVFEKVNELSPNRLVMGGKDFRGLPKLW